MKHLHTLFATLLILGLVAACSGPIARAPETLPEKLAAMEVGYGQVLDTIALYKQEGRLSESDLGNLKTLNDRFTTARNAAYVAFDIGSLQNAESQYLAALALLTEMRKHLGE